MKYFLEHKNIEKLDRNIVLSLIEKVIIHEEARIEIVFKYEDEYKAAVRIAKSFSETFHKEVLDYGKISK